jgi:hypothetical protein
MQLSSLAECIQAMGPAEHAEVFRMLSQYGARFSHNANGRFVNLAAVPPEAVEALRAFAMQRAGEPPEPPSPAWLAGLEGGGAHKGAGGPAGGAVAEGCCAAAGDGLACDGQDRGAPVAAGESAEVKGFLEALQRRREEALARRKALSQRYRVAHKRYARLAELRYSSLLHRE